MNKFDEYDIPPTPLAYVVPGCYLDTIDLPHMVRYESPFPDILDELAHTVWLGIVVRALQD